MPGTIANQALASTTVVTTAETAAVSSSAYVYDFPNSAEGGSGNSGNGILISGIVNISPFGTGSTLCTVRIRQGTGITGAIVNDPIVRTVTAGTSVDISIMAIDNSRWTAQAGGGTYTLSVQMTGATGNSTIVYALIQIEAL